MSGWVLDGKGWLWAPEPKQFGFIGTPEAPAGTRDHGGWLRIVGSRGDGLLMTDLESRLFCVERDPSHLRVTEIRSV